jgi:hypothetical protein
MRIEDALDADDIVDITSLFEDLFLGFIRRSIPDRTSDIVTSLILTHKSHIL